MGRVDCCSVPGLDLFFHSDDHGPPHVHVRRPGEWEIRVDLLLTGSDWLEYSVKWPRSFAGPKSKMERTIRDMVVQYREALLEEWDTKVIGDYDGTT